MTRNLRNPPATASIITIGRISIATQDFGWWMAIGGGDWVVVDRLKARRMSISTALRAMRGSTALIELLQPLLYTRQYIFPGLKPGVITR